jgi:hypothetical protein
MHGEDQGARNATDSDVEAKGVEEERQGHPTWYFKLKDAGVGEGGREAILIDQCRDVYLAAHAARGWRRERGEQT